MARLLRGTVLVVCCVILTASTAPAAPAEQKSLAFVVHTGEDTLGVSLLQAIRDELEHSASVSYTAKPDDAELVVFVSTLDPNRDKPGLTTTAAWTLVYMRDTTKVYISSGLVLTDAVRVSKAAAELVAQIDSLLKVRRAELPGSPEWQQYVAKWNEAVDRVAETLPEDACGVRVRAAFREELRVCLRWSMAANLTFSVEDIIKAVTADYVTDAEFVKKLQSQSENLGQCQSDLTALRKSLATNKK